MEGHGNTEYDTHKKKTRYKVAITLNYLFSLTERANRIARLPFNGVHSYYRIFCYDDFIIPLFIYGAGGKNACSSCCQ